MPSKSEKQKRFMTIAAKSPEFAKKVNIDQEVAKEFHEADKAKAGKKKAEKVSLEVKYRDGH